VLPPGEDWRQVLSLGVGRTQALAVAAEPTAAVLVREVAPAEDRRRPVWDDAVGLCGIGLLGSDGAEVGPIVAEVEDVGELLARRQAAELRAAGVDDYPALVLIGVRRTDAGAVSERELV